MTEEEWKGIEDLVSKIHSGKCRCGMAAQSCLLAAFAELKERREDEEWLKVNGCLAYMDEGGGWSIDKGELVGGEDDTIWNCIVLNASTIHAAITAARGK